MERAFFVVDSYLIPTVLKKTDNNDTIYPYILPKIYPKNYRQDKGCKRRWYVEYGAYNLETKKIESLRKYIKGDDYGRRIDEANKLIRAISHALANGATYQPKEKKRKKSEVTHPSVIKDIVIAFEQIERLYKAEGKQNTIRSIRSEKGMFLSYVSKELPHHELEDLEKSDIINYLDKEQIDKGISNTTKAGKKNRLHMMFARMVDKGWIKNNPAEGIKIKKSASSEKHKVYSNEQKELILSTVREKDHQLWFAIHFIYYAFIRPGELRTLKVGNVNIDQGNIVVNAAYSKSDKKKVPTISEPFREILTQMNLHLYPHDYFVFGNEGKPGPHKVSTNHFGELFRQVRDELKLGTDYTLYGWKHTGNVDCALAGLDLKSLQLQNGHHDLSMTDKYLRNLGVYIDSNIKLLQPRITPKKKPSQDT